LDFSGSKLAKAFSAGVVSQLEGRGRGQTGKKQGW